MADTPDSLYSDAPFYDMLFQERRHDIEFYRGLAEGHEGPILELGVGTGRVARALARDGHRVVGVDYAPEMIGSLRRALAEEGLGDRVELHRADVKELSLGRRFSLILCPFNGLAHSHELAELEAFFGAVRRHLAPGGLFAFDLLFPDESILGESSSLIPSFEHPGDGKIYRFEERMHYAPLTQILSIDSELRPMKEEGEPTLRSLRLRLFFPRETELLLSRCGWRMERRKVLGDVLVYLCRAGEEALS